MAKIKLIPFEQHLDECIGKVGTPDRDELEAEVAQALFDVRTTI